METTFCDFEAASYIFLSPEVGPLIFYSHTIAMFSALAISLLVFLHNPRHIISKLFLLFAVFFGTWAFLDLILWATNDPGIVLFSWSIQVLLEPLSFAVAFYLLYLFIKEKLPPLSINIAAIGILLPLVVFLPTALNLEAVYLSSCESEEGPLAQYYTYFVNIIFISLILYYSIREIPKLKEKRATAVLFAVGLVTFLLAFTSGNVLSSFTDDWTISQYGLFGMPVFAGLIAYSIVKFNAFKIQIAGAQVLVVVLWMLVGSLLFVEAELLKVITGITLAFTIVTGYFLVRSVRHEFEQRKEIEDLAEKLKKANKRLRLLDQMKSEFVSIASHQLRSPLTSIRGYASMILEGSFGKVPKKAEEAISRIHESSRYMALSVEDFLNVSRIESGKMKYELSEFNLKEVAQDVVNETRQVALQKGLLLSFDASCKSSCLVKADIGKVRQALHNLIDNAIKYTPKGDIHVSVSDDLRKKIVHVSIKDTGIGMNEETMKEIFDKFVRAKNANNVNVTGSGLGLFVAKEMVEHMGGTISPHSDGKGQGSTFTLSLPLATKKK